MAKVVEPKPDSLMVRAIYAAREAREDVRPRRYLGASQIGNPCERAIWYAFRWALLGLRESGRVLRLFDAGRGAEQRIGAELRGIGCQVHLVGTDGKQFGFTRFHGHFGANLDGCALHVPDARDVWHVLEFKTHNQKSFAALQRHGVRESKPEHFAQMQVYMGGTGMRWALYVAENKNTSELYTERVEFVPAFHDALMASAERIIKTDEPPARLNEDPDYFACKFCSYASVCHTPALPDVTCRTCHWSFPDMAGEPEGSWRCHKHAEFLSYEKQLSACPDHLYIPLLINGASVADAGETPEGDFIEYRDDESGRTFRNSQAPGGFTSRELQLTVAANPALVTDPTLARIKTALDGKVVLVEPIGEAAE